MHSHEKLNLASNKKKKKQDLYTEEFEQTMYTWISLIRVYAVCHSVIIPVAMSDCPWKYKWTGPNLNMEESITEPRMVKWLRCPKYKIIMVITFLKIVLYTCYNGNWLCTYNLDFYLQKLFRFTSFSKIHVFAQNACRTDAFSEFWQT